MASAIMQAMLDVLEGIVPYDDAAPAIQSWARYFFYEAADEIITLPTIEDRRAALSNIPDGLRPYVEAEVRRLWAFYRT